MEKYLRHYAEPEIAAFDDLPDPGQWANVVVIPACDETAAFLRPPPSCGGRSLMVLVINEPGSAGPGVSSSNQALAAAVRAQFELRWQAAPEYGLELFRDPHTPRDLLLVDRFSEGLRLPPKSGVGHARKIGADLATCLIHRKHIRSPWIHCTDADVELPDTYFECSKSVQDKGDGYAALVYPFHHCDDPARAENPKIILATQLYELSLRYYVAGMKFARSPYAFHTIGSTMAVSAKHYAKVRGFPKREAGEDFYLLNKLAKVGTVLELGPGPECAPIEIEARRSDRVPFGTGAAVNTITGMADPVGEYRFYHPVVFELLRLWLQSWSAIWGSRSNDLTANILPGTAGEGPVDQRQSLLAGLKHSGAEKALGHAFRQSSDPDQFTRQMHTWFDAFRSLKLIHSLRDQGLPSIPYNRLEVHPVFRQLLAQDLDLRIFNERFRKVSEGL